MQVFGRKAPENGAEGAVLEKFNDFSEKLFLKNAINLKLGYMELIFFVQSPEKLSLKTAIKCEKGGI